MEREDDSLHISLLTKKPKEGGPKGATQLVLFALCQIHLEDNKQVEHFVESVVDSSRYFVMRISDEKSGRHANIGVGFRERDDASNFRMALQDYERSLQREKTAEVVHMLPEVGNLTLKEGEKIHIDFKGKSSTTTIKGKPTVAAKPSSGGALPLLKKPPPSPAVVAPKVRAVGGINLNDAISDVASTVGSEGAVGSLTDAEEEEEWNDYEGE